MPEDLELAPTDANTCPHAAPQEENRVDENPTVADAPGDSELLRRAAKAHIERNREALTELSKW